MPQGIEDSHEKGHDPHEKKIREQHPGQRDGQRHFFRGPGEAGGDQLHDARRQEHPCNRCQSQDQDKEPEGGPGQGIGFRFSLPGKTVGKHRDEGDAQRPFGQQTPHQVGDTEGHEKGVRAGAGAEKPCDDRVSDKPEDPAHQGGPGHDPGSPDDPAAFIHGKRPAGIRDSGSTREETGKHDVFY